MRENKSSILVFIAQSCETEGHSRINCCKNHWSDVPKQANETSEFDNNDEMAVLTECVDASRATNSGVNMKEMANISPNLDKCQQRFAVIDFLVALVSFSCTCEFFKQGSWTEHRIIVKVVKYNRSKL